jgi:hypothetical protein
MVLRGTTFHTEVPAFAGAEIDELLCKHAKVLPGDARRRTICFTVPVRPMARRAMVEKRFTIDCIGSGSQRAVEFPLRLGRGDGEARKQQGARKSQNENLQVSYLKAFSVLEAQSLLSTAAATLYTW